MKRKILSLILVFAMTVSLLTVGTGAVEPTYGDTAGHWAESSIERWSGHGIIQGSNGQFDPNGQLTCAQLATILAKLLKLPAAPSAGFSDVAADAWYADAINRCVAAGILNGNGDGTVSPTAPITRERAMVMLGRALGIQPIENPDLSKYGDAAKVSAYAQGYVAAMIEAGIVTGVGSNQIAPQDDINRASTVTILDRAIAVYADKDGATIDAKDGGLILIVAENVKVVNAPEGTTVVAADGATGLTVNDKAVTDDQTYVVPKTEPAKPSSGSSSGGSSGGHSHTIATEWSFDDTYHWHEASCNSEAHRSDKAEHTRTYTDKTADTHKVQCSECGWEKTENHTWGDWETITSATCTTDGIQKHSCTACGYEATETIPSTEGHNYVYSTDWDTTLVSTKSCSNEGCNSEETINDIYYIASDVELGKFRDWVNGTGGKSDTDFAGKTIKLTANIDLKNEEWTPIGTNENPFSGSFDGQNHTVSNLKITNAGSYNGLFGKVVGIADGASYKTTADEVWNAETYTLSNCDESQFKTIIKDFTIDGFSVTTGEYGAAAIGWAENAYVSNITVSNGSVTDAGATKQGKVAAIVGVSAKNMVYNQLVTANNVSVTGSKHTVAGIVSNVQRGNNNQPHLVVIKDCVNNAAVNWTTGEGTTGGLPIAGIIANAGSCNGLEVVIYKCTNNGTITAGECNYACGIVGQSGVQVKAIYDCHNTGNIIASAYTYGVAGICITESTPAIACSNTGVLTNNATGGYAYDISGSTSQLTVVNETFADIAALQTRINNAVGTATKLILKDITVTNPTGELNIPAGVQSVSSNTKVCDSINLPDALVDINMVGLTQTVTGTVCRTFSGSGNTITVAENTTIGKIVIAGTNNTFTNNGTTDNVAISGSGTGIVINNESGATMAGMTMIATTATVTLNNHGTMNRTSTGGHCVWVEANGTLTVNNYGSISAANEGNSNAMLFYGNCTITVYAYNNSSVTHGFAPYSGKHTINIYYQEGATYGGESWDNLPDYSQYGVTVNEMQ